MKTLVKPLFFFYNSQQTHIKYTLYLGGRFSVCFLRPVLPGALLIVLHWKLVGEDIYSMYQNYYDFFLLKNKKKIGVKNPAYRSVWKITQTENIRNTNFNQKS